MKAEEVKKISDSKVPTIEQIFDNIKQEAETGIFRHIVVPNFTDKLITELIRAEFDVKVFTDPNFGNKILIISW